MEIIFNWFKADQYEITDQGFIRPHNGSTVKSHSPKANDSCYKKDLREEYTDFLNLFEALNNGQVTSKELSESQKVNICEWCNNNGLLGIFFHRVNKCYFKLRDGRATILYKKHGEWKISVDDKNFKQETDFIIEQEGFTKTQHLFHSQDPAADYTILPENFFFAENIADIALDVSGSPEQLMAYYQEPVELFLETVRKLGMYLLMCTRHKEKFDFSAFGISSEELGIDRLNAFIGTAPVHVKQINNKLTTVMVTPSLLSYIAFTVLKDINDGMMVKRCNSDTCRKYFATTKGNHQFCCPKHRESYHKRMSRNSKRLKRKPEDVCKYCGDPISTDKRADALYCGDSCKAAFNKLKHQG